MVRNSESMVAKATRVRNKCRRRIPDIIPLKAFVGGDNSIEQRADWGREVIRRYGEMIAVANFRKLQSHTFCNPRKFGVRRRKKVESKAYR
jgi:hypothetical protein